MALTKEVTDEVLENKKQAEIEFHRTCSTSSPPDGGASPQGEALHSFSKFYRLKSNINNLKSILGKSERRFQTLDVDTLRFSETVLPPLVAREPKSFIEK